jgi:hydrogenase maturation protein HypF
LTCIKFSIYGGVQGVGFRSYVKTLAKELGVAGEVWNDRSFDGVSVIATASPAVMELFEQGLTLGPGNVSKVLKAPHVTYRKFSKFQISHSK